MKVIDRTAVDEKHVNFKTTDFKKLKGKLDLLYGGDRSLLNIVGSRKSYTDSKRVISRAELEKDFVANLQDPNKIAGVSETLAKLNGIYAEIIQYYISMPVYRYTVIPSLVKKEKKVSAKEFTEIYDKMISVIDGMSLEVMLPKILQEGMLYGIIYMYTDKNNSSDTVETLLLPREYCRKGFTTNFGTETIVFDFKYFDDILAKIKSSNGRVLTPEDLFELYPQKLFTQYNDFKKDATLRWQDLDPKVSAAISFSVGDMPPKIYANYGLIDYDAIKKNEIIRSSNELEKILVHQIPNYEGALMLEVEEALELHDSMAEALSTVNGLKILTTFGPTELIELQPERTKENKAVEQGFRGIFHTAGINPELFIGNSKEAIAATLEKDGAYIFQQIDKIINLYTLAVNNLYNFNPFQAKINMLPMTVYNEIEKVKSYIESANFGIGKLEAVVARGIKQRDITDKYNLEQHLNLDTILTPLSSAYTSTPSDKKEAEKTPAKKETPSKEGEQ